MSKVNDGGLFELKRGLYHAILCKDCPTISEVRIAYEICRDPDIQELLNKLLVAKGEKGK